MADYTFLSIIFANNKMFLSTVNSTYNKLKDT